jgi:hypothetical protein
LGKLGQQFSPLKEFEQRCEALGCNAKPAPGRLDVKIPDEYVKQGCVGVTLSH